MHAGLVESILSVLTRSGLRLTEAEADQYVREQSLLAELAGVPAGQAPMTVAELRAYFDQVRPQLRATDLAREGARFVIRSPQMPFPPGRRVPGPVLTLARPVWIGLAGLCFLALPEWAVQLYCGPATRWSAVTRPAVTAGLRTLRALAAAVPVSLPGAPRQRHRDALVRWACPADSL